MMLVGCSGLQIWVDQSRLRRSLARRWYQSADSWFYDIRVRSPRGGQVGRGTAQSSHVRTIKRPADSRSMIQHVR